jgi:hypothetical protein
MITFLYRRVCTHRETDPRSRNAKIAMWAGCDRASITASAGSLAGSRSSMDAQRARVSGP